jgi:hypothetical protein
LNAWAGFIEVFDIRSRRRSVLTEDLGFIRAHAFPLPADAILRVSPERFILNAEIAGTEHAGMPLHLVDSLGKILRSFGGTGYYRRDAAWLLRYRLANARPQEFWAAPQTEYRFTRWSTNGRMLADYIRTPSWFPPGRRRQFRRDVAPAAMVEAIAEAGDGLLWVVTSVPDRRWAEQFTDRPADQAFNGDFGRFLDSIIELIDPATAAIVAQVRLDSFVRGFLDADEAFAYRLDSNGVPYVDVVQLKIEKIPDRGRRCAQSQRQAWRTPTPREYGTHMEASDETARPASVACHRWDQHPRRRP